LIPARTDDSAPRKRHDAGMSYAVLWHEDGGPDYAGKLALDPRAILFSGSARDARDASRLVPFDELVDTHFERRDGPVLVLVGRGGHRFEIASLEGAGALHELAEQVENARGKVGG
jgi:hypothetical protein